MTKKILAVTLLLSLLGCGTAPTYSQKALGIQVHTQMTTLLDKCKNLGRVSATGHDTTIGTPWAVLAAENLVREQVADLGGDTFVMLKTDRVSNVTSVVQGVAFRCY